MYFAGRCQAESLLLLKKTARHPQLAQRCRLRSLFLSLSLLRQRRYPSVCLFSVSPSAMVYIEGGQVRDRRSMLRPTIVIDVFWGIVNFVWLL